MPFSVRFYGFHCFVETELDSIARLCQGQSDCVLDAYSVFASLYVGGMSVGLSARPPVGSSVG